MRALLFVAIALVGSALGDEVPTEENVLVLSKSNFDGVVSSNNFILVEFYAPWCGHCKSLAPEYAKAATKLSEEGSPIKLAKVDATQEQELAENYGVRGYPTLKFFKNGNPIDYTGGRQADDIVAWLKKKTGPPAVEVSSLEQAKELTAANNVIVFGFFPDQETDNAKTFLNVAGLTDDTIFAIVADEKLAKDLESEANTIVLFKNFEEPKVVYDGEVTEDAIKKWVFVNSMPYIVEFSHETASKIFGGQIKYHLLLFLSKKNGDFEKYIDVLKPVAKNYQDKIMTVAIDTDEDDHQRILEFFGMKKEEVPSARLIALEQDMAKYKPPTNELSANAIEEFVQSFFDGKLKQHLLSEELPADWAAKPVKVLVATNFDDVVFDTTKRVLVEFYAPCCHWAAKPVKVLVATNFDDVVFDTTKRVLVEFYAPWCGHCKQLAPIYDKLGEHFEKDEDTIIAKMDATVNELEHTKITSFPTIKLYTKDNQVIDNVTLTISKMDATVNELEHTKITSFPTIKLYTKDNQVIDNVTLTISKMDATVNELEHTKITSFPTIKLYTKDNQVKDYNGERTLAGLTKFVEMDGETGEPTPSPEFEDDQEDEQPARDEL
ncbi:thioredoxin domain-containing protein [Phthorimaea operculella]|nr:thioredoxin domain-containing protein [Phthorimaea operculella]